MDHSAIIGLHSISNDSLLHALVGQKGDLWFDDLNKKASTEKSLQMKGNKIHKSYLGSKQIIAISKETTL